MDTDSTPESENEPDARSATTASAPHATQPSTNGQSPVAQAEDPAVLEALARQGQVEAMYQLASMLGTEDPVAAELWYTRAAEAGDARAMNDLAQLLNDDDHEAALQWFERAAEAGNTTAMRNLGVLLEDADPVAAYGWYRRAAEAGSCDGMFAVALMLEGHDDHASRLWYTRAAEAGDTRAMNNLGHGLLEDCDRAAALRWFERAAEAGNVNAMNNLGVLLEDADPAAAYGWHERAAEAGSCDGMFAVALMLADHDDHASRLWYTRAAEAGDTRAMNNLARCLAEGGDREAALRWLERAAEAGDPLAMNNLANLLEDDDREAARRWYERAAEAGDPTAMRNLGVLLEDADPVAAYGWYERAAEAGNTAAMNNLALLLRRAEQATRDATPFSPVFGFREPDPAGALFDEEEPEKARRWLQRAIDAGSVDAMNNMGVLLENADPAASLDWYRKAAEAGAAIAMVNLANIVQDDDPAESKRWFRKAIDAGHPGAEEGLREMIRRGRLHAAGAVLVLVLCAMISAVGFRAFGGANYLIWYVTNGTAIGLLTALVTLTIDLDRIPNLISPSPRKYLRACRMVLNLPTHAWAPAFLPPGVRFTLRGDTRFHALDRGSSVTRTTVTTAPDGTKTIRSERKVAGLYNVESDSAEIEALGPLKAFKIAPLTATVVGLVMAAFFAWFIVLAPIQYVTSAVLGTPVRRMRQHGVTVLYSDTDQSIHMHRPDGPAPTAMSEVQFYRRPVTTTLAISSLALWLISLAL